MPRGRRIASAAAIAAFVALAGGATLVVLGGRPGRPIAPRAARSLGPDGRWRIEESRSYARTSLLDVKGLRGELEVVRRRIQEAHISGGGATFDLSRPIDLGALRQGRELPVEVAGKAHAFLVSREVSFRGRLLWQGNRMRLEAGDASSGLHLVIKRLAARAPSAVR